ncbi:MAG: hypothetical protein ACFFCI_05785 [Promethearchaeota archaeon]
MERISSIIKELNEKTGKEWLSLQPKTEQQLESLVWYLNHPKVQEDLNKVEELVELYYNAKATDFLKMERIARKLDELNVKIGKVDYIKKKVISSQPEIISIEKPTKPTIVNYDKAIEELRIRIEKLLNSAAGSNLHENTQISITTFLKYLNHPELQNNTELFDEMLEKYEQVEAVDFTTMQTFNNLLNKIEIKLGKVSEELKTWKSINEREKDLKREVEKLEKENKKVKENEEKLELEKKQLTLEWEKLEVERGKLIKEKEKLNEERQKFTTEKAKLTLERAELSLEQSNLESEKEKLEIVRKKLEEMQQKLEEEISKI